MYNRVLVPTDGSATAEAAMEHANDLAKRYDADVHVSTSSIHGSTILPSRAQSNRSESEGKSTSNNSPRQQRT